MDIRHRLEYARKVRGKTRHGIFLQLQASGQKVPNRTKRDVYGFFSDATRKTPPLPTLEALALILEVRVAWLRIPTKRPTQSERRGPLSPGEEAHLFRRKGPTVPERSDAGGKTRPLGSWVQLVWGPFYASKRL